MGQKNKVAVSFIPQRLHQVYDERPDGAKIDRSKVQMDSDSDTSFNSLFDEPESNPHRHLARKDDKTPRHKNPLKSPIVAIGKKQRLISPSPSKFNPVTPPRQNTSYPTTPQSRIPASPAPIAKMVPSQKDLPKLSIPHSASTPTRRQSRENSTITTSSTLIGESPPSSSQFRHAKSPSASCKTPTATSTKPPQFHSTSNPPPTTSKTSPQSQLQARPPNPSSSPRTLTAATPPQTQLVENTTLKIFLHGHKGFRPLLLKDCLLLPPSQFFARIIGAWSLPVSSSAAAADDDDDHDDTVQQQQQLHITFPWLPITNRNRLMILDRSNVEAGLACLIHEIETAFTSCASSCENTGERGRRSIDITILQTTQGVKEDGDDVFAGDVLGARSKDGRSMQHMSMNAITVYCALRENAHAAGMGGRGGLRVQEIAEMVGMEVADVVVAGSELLAEGWILRGL